MAEKIDVRRVQLTGGATRVISLPKIYADDVGITCGTLVEMYREGNDLILRPVIKSVKEGE